MAYIEREALKTELQKKIELSHNARRAVIEEDFKDIINDMPAADVVEVVRCKDCKHCDPDNRHCDHYMGTVLPVSREDNDFCSYGERKDGE